MDLADDQIEKIEIEEAHTPPTPRRAAGFVLSKWDLEILRFVWQHRFLRRDQLAVLTGRSPKKLHDRLLKMCELRYLKLLLKLPLQKHIYGIAKEGIRVLVSQGIAPMDLLDQRQRGHELTDYYLKHEMLIVDTHIALTIASKGPIRLVEWEQGRQIYDSVMVDGERIPVSPDSFFALQDSRRPAESDVAHFFLEADRSSENHRYFQKKIIGAANYYRQKLHERKFKIKGFRVLTVALNEQRARELCTLAQSLLPEGSARKMFLFTSMESISLQNPETIFGHICFSPRDQDVTTRRPLMPAPPSAAALQSESAVV